MSAWSQGESLSQQLHVDNHAIGAEQRRRFSAMSRQIGPQFSRSVAFLPTVAPHANESVLVFERFREPQFDILLQA
jgi:hypothetical protein